MSEENTVIAFDMPPMLERLPTGVYECVILEGPRWAEGKYGRQLEYVIRVERVLTGEGAVGAMTRLWVSPQSRRQVEAAVGAGLIQQDDSRCYALDARGVVLTVISEGGKIRLLRR